MKRLLLLQAAALHSRRAVLTAAVLLYTQAKVQPLAALVRCSLQSLQYVDRYFSGGIKNEHEASGSIRRCVSARQ